MIHTGRVTRQRPRTRPHGETAPLDAPERRLAVYVVGEPGRPPVPLDRTLRVGRDEDCDIALNHASVSRLHATLEPANDAGEVTVVDCGSRNGTWVGDAKLPPRGRGYATRTTIVRVGDVALVLDGARAAAPATEEGAGAALLQPLGAMKEVLDLAGRLAADDITVLITGETGVGKEIMARWLHEHSARASGPLVPVHAAALSPSLFESELFGHERGAFTGAATERDGLLAQADGGTLFFDEIGELPLDLQPKLLRVLEDRRVVRVGGRTARVVDVRIVAATNRDLQAEVARGAFRADLYFRLGAFPLVIPPLRERVAEVPALARALLAAACARRGRAPASLTEAALARLAEHPWPGNVRELSSALSRALLMAPPGAIALDALDVTRALGATTSPAHGTAPATAAEPDDERARIEQALARHAGNQSAAAAELRIARRTLLYKLDRLGIPRPRKTKKR